MLATAVTLALRKCVITGCRRSQRAREQRRREESPEERSKRSILQKTVDYLDWASQKHASMHAYPRILTLSSTDASTLPPLNEATTVTSLLSRKLASSLPLFRHTGLPVSCVTPLRSGLTLKTLFRSGEENAQGVRVRKALDKEAQPGGSLFFSPFPAEVRRCAPPHRKL